MKKTFLNLSKKLVIVLLSIGTFISCQNDEDIVDVKTDENVVDVKAKEKNIEVKSKYNYSDGISFDALSKEEIKEKLKSTTWEITEFNTTYKIRNKEFIPGSRLNFYSNEYNDGSLDIVIYKGDESATGTYNPFATVFGLIFKGKFHPASNYYKMKTSFFTNNKVVIRFTVRDTVYSELVFTAVKE